MGESDNDEGELIRRTGRERLIDRERRREKD